MYSCTNTLGSKDPKIKSGIQKSSQGSKFGPENRKDPANNCLDVAIITAPEKRTQKTKDKLKNIAGRVLNK